MKIEGISLIAKETALASHEDIPIAGMFPVLLLFFSFIPFH